jgi:hypothetical protein
MLQKRSTNHLVRAISSIDEHLTLALVIVERSETKLSRGYRKIERLARGVGKGETNQRGRIGYFCTRKLIRPRFLNTFLDRRRNELVDRLKLGESSQSSEIKRLTHLGD